MFKVKDNVVLLTPVGNTRRDVLHAIVEHGLNNSTIIVMGNYFSHISYDDAKMNIHLEKLIGICMQTDCNVVITRGSDDDREFFRRLPPQLAKYSDMIYLVGNTAVLDEYCILAGGAPWNPLYCEDLTESEIRKESFQLNALPLLKARDVKYVISFIYPSDVVHSDFVDAHSQHLPVYFREVLKEERDRMWIAYQLLTMNNHIEKWIYFSEMTKDCLHKHHSDKITEFIGSGLDHFKIF